MFETFPAECERALTPADAVRIHAAGKRAIFLGMENGYPIGQDLALLEAFHRRGIRYLTLCHAADNDICASATSGYGTGVSSMASRLQADTGLTPFGASVVARLNDLGMLVDVSHASDRTVDEVVRISRTPVLASHSGARSVSDHPRNLADPQVRAIADRGGVVQVCFVPEFLRPGPPDPGGPEQWRLRDRVAAHYADHAIGEDPGADDGFEGQHQELLRRFPPVQATVRDVADHIDHVVRVAGIEHVGIGSDFDGGGRLADCRDASELPALTAELLRRGYAPGDLRLIWGGNAMRVLGEAQALAR
jgi:membrane dipeptidase